ncbi:MAG TPA: AAA-like domain-containing protein [Blastocatellia bacterium]|nr:AAA-like domain-containing protein [Blastocatellia bacterium]
MSETRTQPVVFTTGGTVQAGNGIYLARRADEELLALCRKSVFAYILTARQLGKSSLMTRTAERLNAEGTRTVIIDLTSIGVNVTAEQWYLGLLTSIEEQLELEADAVGWWQERGHLGLTQRLTMFFEEVVLAEIAAPVVVFVDEIDTTLSLKFSDDFFAAIRYFYNARAQVEAFQRLSFVLIGVATPGDLIKDEQRTPFNVGQRVELTDFTLEEALPLADGFNLPAEQARQTLEWVLKWTGGHPYLTQRLCRALAEAGLTDWTEAEVDRIVARTFLGERSEQDNNLQFVRDMLTKRAPDQEATLTTYREVLNEKSHVADQEQSLVKSHLKLSGVVQRSGGELRVRNLIYRTVFDEEWVRKHLPVNWAQRLLRAASILIVILLFLSGPLAIFAWVQWSKASTALIKAEGARQEADQQREEAIQQRKNAEEARAREQAQREMLEKDQKQLQDLIDQLQQQTGESGVPLSQRLRMLLDAQKKLAAQQQAVASRAQNDAAGLRDALDTANRELGRVKVQLDACHKAYDPKKQAGR